MKKSVTLLGLMIFATGMAVGLLGCNSIGRSSGGDNAKATGRASAKSSLPDEPDVTFKDLDGKDIPLTSLRGKVVVVNFWATWCDPCRVEIPWMIGFQQKYAAKGFTILGVAMDDEGKKVVEPFVKSQTFDVDGHPMAMNYLIVLGNDDIAQKFGGLIGLPTTYVISRDGKIAKRFIGLVNRGALEKEIEGLL